MIHQVHPYRQVFKNLDEPYIFYLFPALMLCFLKPSQNHYRLIPSLIQAKHYLKIEAENHHFTNIIEQFL